MLIQLKRLLRKILLLTIDRIYLRLLRHILLLQLHHLLRQLLQYVLSLPDLPLQLGTLIKLRHFICSLAQSHDVQLILFDALVDVVKLLHHSHLLLRGLVHVVLLEVFEFLFCFFCLANGFCDTEFCYTALLFEVFDHLFQDVRVVG